MITGNIYTFGIIGTNKEFRGILKKKSWFGNWYEFEMYLDKQTLTVHAYDIIYTINK